MEKWDILNSNGDKTGRKAIRGRTLLKNGEYHMVVHIWIISSDGRLLIQRRSENKHLMPGEWAATGGAAMSGESSVGAAMRELKEELGIESTKETLKFISRLKRRNSFVDIYFIRCDIPEDKLILQKSEVSSAKWVTKQQLENMILNGEYHNYGKFYWSVVFSRFDKELKNGI